MNHHRDAFAVFFFTDTATTETYTLSLHDALPIYKPGQLRPADIEIRRRLRPLVGHNQRGSHQLTHNRTQPAANRADQIRLRGAGAGGGDGGVAAWVAGALVGAGEDAGLDGGGCDG